MSDPWSSGIEVLSEPDEALVKLVQSWIADYFRENVQATLERKDFGPALDAKPRNEP